jgi:hypothetical protein
MPRIIHKPDTKKNVNSQLVEELARELKSARRFGQPLIEETEFTTKAIKVYVIWDRWDRIADTDRSETILQAYEKAEGKEYRDRVTLAIGVTVPEAHELGMVPFGLEPSPSLKPAALKKCHQAMRSLGASDLMSDRGPELWLASREDAEAARRELMKLVPEGDWLLTKEIST